jgi:LmeA-like phospholipid-binding
VGTAGRIGLGLAGAATLVLLGAQVFLPRIAAGRISSRVGRYGTVESVSVRAWPAVELLWGSADSVSVRARSLSLSPTQAAKLVWEARGVSRMDFTARSVVLGPLRLSGARLRKRDSSLTAQAVIGAADVKAALPGGFNVQLVKSEAGEVRVRASGGLFGVSASVPAVAGASEGRLIARPVGFLIGGFRLTLFSDPHVFVEAVGASVASPKPLSYRLTISAHLR